MSRFLAGVDDLSLDKRIFDPSRNDIQRICRFFCIGKLLQHEKEKGISVSHSNFFVFAATTHGRYALKFYPKDMGPMITTEYAINRILAHHHFHTPPMHAGIGGKPFSASNDRLAACYSYVNGFAAWKHINRQKIIHRINANLHSLNEILSVTKGRILLKKQSSLTETIKTLARDASCLPDGPKRTVNASLLDVYRRYQQYRSLFVRQRLHNNINLTNLLIDQKTVYVLDLSHVREDYALADLASLVISCMFFNIPVKTIQTIIKDYFGQQQMKKDHLPALNCLVKIGLIKEYLKNALREKWADPSGHPPELVRTYRSHLSQRKDSILKKMNAIPRIIV